MQDLLDSIDTSTLSDTYPDSVSNERLLILYDVENNRRYDIGSFYTDPNLGLHRPQPR
jgi:hypothetical protein